MRIGGRSLFATAFVDFRRTWPQLVLTDLLARAATVVLVTPLVTLLVDLFLRTTDEGVLADAEIAGFLLHPVGLAALVVVGAVSLGVWFTEVAVLMAIGYAATGDRELSSMRSLMVGARITWSVPANDEGWVLGFLNTLDLVAKADLLKSWFDDFHYGSQTVPNTLALIGSLNLQAGF